MNGLITLTKKKNFLLKLILLLLFLVLPWTINNSSDELNAQEITDDLSFYQINTCEFSLMEIIIENPKITYQKHFKLRPNNYSSYRCFGKITGIDRIGNTFFISIGTNTLIAMILKSLTLLLCFSLIKTNDAHIRFLSKKYNSTLVLSSLILTYGVYAEKRFYAKSLYFMDLEQPNTYFIIYAFMFFVTFLCLEFINNRYKNIVNFFPFMFLFIAVIGGMNLHIYTFFLVIFGVLSLFEKRKNLFIYIYLSFLGPLFWIINANKYDFTIYLDKIVGFSSSSMNLHSTIYWSIVFFLAVNGLYNFIKNNIDNINFELLKNNFLITSFLIVFLGLLGANATLFNFLNFYYFGQNKTGMSTLNVADGNAWRGFFPSAETIGEFYGLSLLLFLLVFLKNRNGTNKFELLLLGVTFFGLIKSNNASAFIAFVIFSLGYFMSINKKYRKQVIMSSGVVIVLFFTYLVFRGSIYSLDFTNSKIVQDVLYYKTDYQQSSFLTHIQGENSQISKLIIGIVSTVSFYINRSILWGLFFTRYNPTSYEFLFGTGPLSLSKHYSEIGVSNYDAVRNDTKNFALETFLLPHSSLLNILLYFGLLGVLIIGIYIFRVISKRNSIDSFIFYPLMYLLINYIKSDSILYLPSFVLIFFFLTAANQSINKAKD